MTATIRYPINQATVSLREETSQIITVLNSAAGILAGGAAVYTDIAALRPDTVGSESPYIGIVVEFSSPTAQIVGNGTTQLIGLYGEILPADTGVTNQRALLGILGYNIGNQMPQIPLTAQAAANVVGCSIVSSFIGVYNRISIGSVFSDIVVTELTVRLRPFHLRAFPG